MVCAMKWLLCIRYMNEVMLVMRPHHLFQVVRRSCCTYVWVRACVCVCVCVCVEEVVVISDFVCSAWCLLASLCYCVLNLSARVVLLQAFPLYCLFSVFLRVSTSRCVCICVCVCVCASGYILKGSRGHVHVCMYASVYSVYFNDPGSRISRYVYAYVYMYISAHILQYVYAFINELCSVCSKLLEGLDRNVCISGRCFRCKCCLIVIWYFREN